MKNLVFSVLVMSDNRNNIEIFYRKNMADTRSVLEDETFNRKLSVFEPGKLITVSVRIYECDTEKSGIQDYDFLEARFIRDYRFVQECKEIGSYEFSLK